MRLKICFHELSNSTLTTYGVEQNFNLVGNILSSVYKAFVLLKKTNFNESMQFVFEYVAKWLRCMTLKMLQVQSF